MAHKNKNVSGMYLPDIYAPMSRHLELYSMRSYDQFDSSNVDALVTLEMTRRKENYDSEEQKYVDQMMTENPVVVERRNANNNIRNSNSSNAANGYSSDDTQNSGSSSVQHQQRADSCRRSRINNKIKKAKMRFRHKFAAQKLQQSTQVLGCLQDLIRQTEAQLVSSGHSQSTLQKMKNQMGAQDNIRTDILARLQHTN